MHSAADKEDEKRLHFNYFTTMDVHRAADTPEGDAPQNTIKSKSKTKTIRNYVAPFDTMANGNRVLFEKFAFVVRKEQSHWEGGGAGGMEAIEQDVIEI